MSEAEMVQVAAGFCGGFAGAMIGGLIHRFYINMRYSRKFEFINKMFKDLKK